VKEKSGAKDELRQQKQQYLAHLSSIAKLIKASSFFSRFLLEPRLIQEPFIV